MSTTKKFSEYEKHKSNPFIGMSKIELVRKTDYFGTDTVMFQQGTGEVSGVSIMARRRKVDGERFVKLYTDRISSWLDLTKNAQRVLVYLMSEMRPGSDKILFSLDDAMSVTQYRSEAPIYSALAELITRNVIARSNQTSVYFINPYFMFSGDRVVFMESLEKMPGESTDQTILPAGDNNAVLALPVTEEKFIDFE